MNRIFEDKKNVIIVGLLGILFILLYIYLIPAKKEEVIENVYLTTCSKKEYDPRGMNETKNYKIYYDEKANIKNIYYESIKKFDDYALYDSLREMPDAIEFIDSEKTVISGSEVDYSELNITWVQDYIDFLSNEYTCK